MAPAAQAGHTLLHHCYDLDVTPVTVTSGEAGRGGFQSGTAQCTRKHEHAHDLDAGGGGWTGRARVRGGIRGGRRGGG